VHERSSAVVRRRSAHVTKRIRTEPREGGGKKRLTVKKLSVTIE
jgi:hypothetical protein